DSPLTGGLRRAIRTILGGAFAVGSAYGRHPGGPKRSIRRNPEMRHLVFVAVGLVVSTGAALAQDVAAGETSFRKCAPCHSIGPDAANKGGPLLNGLNGRPAGSVDGFNYSDANKASGITWSEAVFKEYIKDPRAKVPGTKM